MYRMNGSFYEAPMSLLSSYETNRALLNGCADEALSDEELAAELAPAATFLGALAVWLARAAWRGLVALGEAYAPQFDTADPAATYHGEGLAPR